MVNVSVSDGYRVTLVEADDAAVVVVAGEIDLIARDDLQRVIDQARSGGRRLAIDLSGTTFMDSTGLKVLLQAWRAQTDAGLEMVLRAPSPAVLALIEVAGIGDALTIEPARPSTDG